MRLVGFIYEITAGIFVIQRKNCHSWQNTRLICSLKSEGTERGGRKIVGFLTNGMTSNMYSCAPVEFGQQYGLPD